MKIQSSFIFLIKSKKIESKKEADKPKQPSKEKINFSIYGSIYEYIKKTFPDINHDNTQKNIFKKKFYLTISTGSSQCIITFIINEVADITYLDIIADGDHKLQTVQCMEQTQEKLLNSGIRDKYIDIISYDSVSEYYCNQILPMLNSLERNMRKLLFNTYIVNYGREYYRTTINNEIQNKIYGVIKAKGSGENKEIERIQKFFYSFEFSDIQKLLFTPSWTQIEINERNCFLNENNDLSKLSDEQLRSAISQFTPKSDWDRLFSSKINLADIQDIIEKIRKYRNSIAHFKFFSSVDYIECKKLIKSLNSSILNAIELTENIDFVNKNLESFKTAMSEIRNRLDKLYKTISDSFKENLLTSMKIVESSILPAVSQITKSFWINDPEKINIILAELQDDSTKFENSQGNPSSNNSDEDNESQKEGMETV